VERTIWLPDAVAWAGTLGFSSSHEPSICDDDQVGSEHGKKAVKRKRNQELF